MGARPKVEINKIHTYTGHNDAVYALTLGKEPNIFYSSGGDGNVIEWDLNNHAKGRLVAKVPASVYALHFDVKNNVLIVGQNYEGLHLINVSDQSEIGSLKLSKAAIYDIKIHDGLILVAAAHGEFYIIDQSTLTVLKKSYLSEQNLRSILVLQDGRCLVGASDGQIIEVDLKTKKIVNQIDAHTNSVFALRTGCDGQLVSGGRDAKLKFWNGDLNFEESINAHLFAINDIAFHSSESYFATASMDKTIKIWDYHNRQLIKVIDKARHGGHLSSVNKLAWSTFDNFLISCSDDRSISVWDAKIGE